MRYASRIANATCLYLHLHFRRVRMQNPEQGCPAVGKKNLRNANRKEGSRGRSLLHGHETFSTSKVGGRWLVAVGEWRLVAVGRWWRLAVGGGWRSVVPRAVFSKKKKSGCLRTALVYRLGDPRRSGGTGHTCACRMQRSSRGSMSSIGHT